MVQRTTRQSIAGPAGAIECAIDLPEGAPPRGLALVCHPHPLQGGTLDNKVVQTVARAVVQLGWQSVRFNFRGIGASEGSWDDGRGEIDDAVAVLQAFRAAARQSESGLGPIPVLVAGFSFGGYVASEVTARLPESDKPRRLVLVGPSTEKHRLPPAPADTLVIHGETDDVVPLAATLAWARPQGLPVVVFPGVGHFFHGSLVMLKQVVLRGLADLSATPTN